MLKISILIAFDFYIFSSSFKAQGVIDDVVNNVIDHIRPGPCRLDWDSLMTSMDILEHFEEVFV